MPDLFPILRSEANAVLCSICPDPGLCCKDFTLGLTCWEDTWAADAARIMEVNDLPYFIPTALRDIAIDPDGKRYGRVFFSCTKLTDAGRCSIYETRPYTCRQYPPGSDPLCAFHPDAKKSRILIE